VTAFPRKEFDSCTRIAPFWREKACAEWSCLEIENQNERCCGFISVRNQRKTTHYVFPVYDNFVLNTKKKKKDCILFMFIKLQLLNNQKLKSLAHLSVTDTNKRMTAEVVKSEKRGK